MLNRRLAIAIPALLLVACSSAGPRTEELLRPVRETPVQPSDLGIPVREAEIPAGGVGIRGQLFPIEGGSRRTVVLFHDSGSNAGRLHPYVSFLHEAGFQVFSFDCRGFGRSGGEASLHAMVRDMPAVLDWLCARPEVDADRLAFYGIGTGASLALRTAARLCRPAALVVEDPVDLREKVYAASERASGPIGAGIAAGLAEFSTIPEDFEPHENAGKISAPLLVIAGEEIPHEDLLASLRTHLHAAGPSALWVIPGTGVAPESLGTEDGQYQRVVTSFLASAFEGRPEILRARVTASERGKTGTWCTVEIARDEAGEPWAVEIAALDPKGAATFTHVWLEGERQDYRILFPEEPGVVGAVRRYEVVREENGKWSAVRTSLARSMRIYAALIGDVEELRHGSPDIRAVNAIARRIRGARDETPFDPRLDAEFADAYARIAEVLSDSRSGTDAAQAAYWKDLADRSFPAVPALHFWPSREPSFGPWQRGTVARPSGRARE
ncbi:MAG: hypothetical protein Fur0037_01610 [Planctomycetota bacterium]